MKILLTAFCFVIGLALTPTQLRANHLLGGELFYQYMSGASNGETYKVTLILYGDCGSAGSNGAFALLNSATPVLEVYNSNVHFSTFNLTIDPANSDKEITPVCPEQKDSTKCSSLSYVLPGVKKYTYTATVTLSGTSADWRFAFEGQLTNSLAGRSTIIGNIFNTGGQVIFLEATLNNTLAPNSSTVYTSPPTPFFCINTPQGYNLGAIDPNGDSLHYSLIPARIDAFTNVNYIAPYSPVTPLPTVPTTFNFSSATGQMNFTPNLTMNSVVVNKVDEYRNGVKVGSNMREMTFVILPNCNNAAPGPGTITGLVNGIQTGPTTIQICQGMNDTLRFGFSTSDANGDSIKISYAGLPSGAVATVTGNNGPAPAFSFKWHLQTMTVGSYTFFVTLEDDGCPLSSKQTIAYTIQVVPFQGTFTTGAQVGCKNARPGFAWIKPIAGTTSDYSFTWLDNNSQTIQVTNGSTTGDSLLNAPPGTYTIQVVNSIGCATTFTVVVPAPAYQAKFDADSAICLNDLLTITNTSTPDLGNWQWTFGDGSTSNAANPVHTYGQPGLFIITLIGETAIGCQDTATALVNVHHVVVAAGPQDTLCQGEIIGLFASGASSYTWKPSAGLSCINCPNPLASPNSTTTYTVVGTDAIGCEDSAEVHIYVVPMGLVDGTGDTTICRDDTAQLHADSAISYLWRPAVFISDTTVADPFVYPPYTMTYTLYGEYELGCKDTVEVTVEMAPNAVVYLPDEVRIYPGESYQMDPGGNALYFHWFPPLGLSNASIANPLAQPPVNTRYFVTATTEYGCRAVDSIDLIVVDESVLDVPNAFSPGSLPNDVLKVVRRGDATLKRFVVFNRWGQKVFESTDINDGWDGRFNGRPQPLGVYVYLVEALTNRGTPFHKQGNVTLIR